MAKVIDVRDAGGLIINGDLTVQGSNTQKPVSVSALPSAAIAGVGARSFVIDSNTTTFNAVAAGGGSNKVPVFSDGSSWRVG